MQDRYKLRGGIPRAVFQDLQDAALDAAMVQAKPQDYCGPLFSGDGSGHSPYSHQLATIIVPFWEQGGA